MNLSVVKKYTSFLVRGPRGRGCTQRAGGATAAPGGSRQRAGACLVLFSFLYFLTRDESVLLFRRHTIIDYRLLLASVQSKPLAIQRKPKRH
jgi:hypothetical protein